MLGAAGVDAIDHGRQRGGFARAGDPGDQHQAARFVADPVDDRRQVKLVQRAYFRGNGAHYDSHVATLLEDADAEAANAGDPVGQVQFAGFLQLLFLPVVHHAESHAQHVFRVDACKLGQGHEVAVNPQMGIIADLQM